jgi:hypothetical protein
MCFRCRTRRTVLPDENEADNIAVLRDRHQMWRAWYPPAADSGHSVGTAA